MAPRERCSGCGTRAGQRGGELVGTVGCEHTRARLPFCSQNAKRDEKAMAMSHGAAALAGGERER